MITRVVSSRGAESLKLRRRRQQPLVVRIGVRGADDAFSVDHETGWASAEPGLTTPAHCFPTAFRRRFGPLPRALAGSQLLLAAFGARWLALGMCVVLGLKGSSQDCDIEGKPDFENAGAAQ